MKWIKLDGKKDPPFKQSLIAINMQGVWDNLYLDEIRHTLDGKQYVFKDQEGNSYTDCTHYLVITNPNEKPKE